MGEIVWPPENVPWAGKGYGLLFSSPAARWLSGLLVPLLSWGLTDTHTRPLPRPLPPVQSVFVLRLSLRACSCVNPRTVSRRFDLCTDQQLPSLLEPRSRAPVFLRVFHFLVITALLGEPGNCTPTTRSGFLGGAPEVGRL